MPQKTQNLLFSFVIPTFNEEFYISRTISDIKSNFAARPADEYEIIIVDNGSTDGTVEIATQANCTVFIEPALGISELRNHGARSSNGRIIVFIDSDVSLTTTWRNDIDEFLPDILAESRQLLGSHYQPFTDTPLPIRLWFVGGYENPRLSFLPGGHTILSRKSFDEIGGFDAAFSTSEDIDFCHRASDMGFHINQQPKLGVIHRGDPQTIRAFLKRECWHGGSDFESLSRVFRSRTSLATLFFIFAHIMLLVAVLAKSVLLATVPVVGIITLTILTSFYLFSRSSLRLRIYNTVNAYLYYLGRCCSVQALFIPSSRD